jgi:hypothetical protein
MCQSVTSLFSPFLVLSEVAQVGNRCRKGTHEACGVAGNVHTEQSDVRVAKKAYYGWRKFGQLVHMENQDARAEGPELEQSHFVTVDPGMMEPGRAPLRVQG